jgi:hypothetical protein
MLHGAKIEARSKHMKPNRLLELQPREDTEIKAKKLFEALSYLMWKMVDFYCCCKVM